ncbi:MAG: ATP-binding protein [archaeon]
MKFRVAAKLVFFMIVITLIVVSSLALISYNAARDSLISRVIAQLDSVSTLKERQLDDFVEEKKSDLENIAHTPNFIELYNQYYSTFLHDPESHEGIYEEFRNNMMVYLEGRNTYFEELFIIAPDGTIHVSTSLENEGKIKTNEEYFTGAKKQTYVKEPFYDLTLQRESMTISTPLIDSNDTFRGVLVARIDLKKISNIMTQRAGLGDTGETYLVNRFNYMITESRSLPGLEYKKAIYTKAVKDCINAKNTIGLSKDYRDHQVLGIYRWIENQGVCLIAEMDIEEALAPANRLGILLIIISAGIVILISVSAVIFSVNLTKPLAKLAQGTEEISHGKFGIAIKMHTHDEIEDLAKSFNSMSQALKNYSIQITHHEKDLNATVTKRTKELQEKLDELENTKKAVMNILEDTDETNRDLVQTKEQLKDKVRKLQDVDSKKDEFISVTAHELKTPLTSIKGFTDLLKMDKIANNKELRNKYFDIILQDTERLGTLITDILDLSRIDLGTMKFNLESIDVASVMADMENFYVFQIKNKKLKPLFVCEKNLPKINVDRQRLIQIISNLINNSLKYTEKGYIKTEAFKKNKFVHFRVSDSGVGIPKEAQPRIFERFFQADSSYTRKVGGSGLGLSICKEFVNAFGGEIWFTSKNGKGTTFEFQLPINNV